MKLRQYQENAITMLYKWFHKNPSGNPVINMPGGSGKSVVIASIVRDAISKWPGTRILMLVHSKELVEQNYKKLRALWPNAPVGIYSASLNRRELGEPITYAGIGSVRNRAKQIGRIDLCLVDEAHAISTTETGTYRKLLADLLDINPSMRIVGLSASPYRLGQGMINEGDEAIFNEVIEPVSIKELVYQGYLAPLRSKVTKHKLNTDGLHKRNGEYITSEMEQRFNTEDNNNHVVKEVMKMASGYKHWLIFCSGIEHSENIAQCFRDAGISAESLTSAATKTERENKLVDFESGKIRALCNVGILTTGYDFQDLDCIVFLRATISPGLYLQMAVRGMRPKQHTDHCLVLDFVGNVKFHGPITAVEPPSKKGNGVAPIKECPECSEIVLASTKECPSCGYMFPAGDQKEKIIQLSDADIMGNDDSAKTMNINEWAWASHTSRTSGKEMLKVTYYGPLNHEPVTEYLPITHDGYAGEKARRLLASMIIKSNGEQEWLEKKDLGELSQLLNGVQHPWEIEYMKDGKFHRVLTRMWS